VIEGTAVASEGQEGENDAQHSATGGGDIYVAGGIGARNGDGKC
jgi:hypothetical protein